MDEMIKSISNYPNGTYLKVQWKNEGIILEGSIDTIYESNNGLSEEDVNYREFYACGFRVENILKNSINSEYNINTLIEISVENQPSIITLQDGSVVWSEE